MGEISRGFLTVVRPEVVRLSGGRFRTVVEAFNHAARELALRPMPVPHQLPVARQLLRLVLGRSRRVDGSADVRGDVKVIEHMMGLPAFSAPACRYGFLRSLQLNSPQRPLAQCPRQCLDVDATAISTDPPRCVQQDCVKAPDRNELVATHWLPVVPCLSLAAAGTHSTAA